MHLKFGSLVWDLQLNLILIKNFTAQKKGMRAVIPGFVRYFYKNGNTPGHTKSTFNKLKILTVQNVIALNSLLFKENVRNFPNILLLSIISPEAPTITSTFESSSSWLGNFGMPVYRNSIFFKGPLLSLREEFKELTTTISKGFLKTYKNRIKGKLFEVQSKGDEIEWVPDNFSINYILGLRKSEWL